MATGGETSVSMYGVLTMVFRWLGVLIRPKVRRQQASAFRSIEACLGSAAKVRGMLVKEKRRDEASWEWDGLTIEQGTEEIWFEQMRMYCGFAQQHYFHGGFELALRYSKHAHRRLHVLLSFLEDRSLMEFPVGAIGYTHQG
jgi:hypothetical protein